MKLLNKLPDDILLNIYLNMEINDLINLSQCNEYFYYNINELVYWNWGKIKYSLEFWKKAFVRTPCISRPLKSMKAELIRIHLFQASLKNNGLQEWNNNDFYTYWYGCEKNYNSKLINLSKL